MKSMLYVIAAVLIIGWIIGFFAFAAVLGSLVHLLLVLAVIILVIRVVKWGIK